MSLFRIFNRNKNNIFNPVNGYCIDITKVNNDAFSKKMLGDGFAVIPSSNLIYAPCYGEIVMIFPTGHAFGIKTKDGKEILVHIGLDTVELNGVGFKILKSKGNMVSPSTAIIEIDREFIKEKGYDDTTVVVLTSNEDKNYIKKSLDKVVEKGDVIIEFEDTI